MNNLSKSKLNSMRKQELLDLCTSLSLDVDGCKVKADYVSKVLEFQEQQRSMSPEASTTDAAAALKAPRVGHDYVHVTVCWSACAGLASAHCGGVLVQRDVC